MTSRIQPCTLRIENRYILYDGASVNAPTADLFDPQSLTEQGRVVDRALGRGEAWFIDWEGRQWVLRHFRRGGLMAKFLSDQYFGWDAEKSRAFREWRLLAELFDLGLPVPRPVAASVERHGGYYRADIITERLPDVLSLAQRLESAPLPATLWRSIGRCIRRFHDVGCWHADLNANNILINAADEVYLIDFDRCRLRQVGGWTQENLSRLLRSLRKLRGQKEIFNFTDEDWPRLLEGYRGEGGGE